MTTNMPILYQNVLLGFPSKYAQDAFLWATDHMGSDPDCYKAEEFADEAERINLACCCLLDAQDRVAKDAGTHRLNPDQRAMLELFMATRHANYRIGGNVKATYAETSAREAQALDRARTLVEQDLGQVVVDTCSVDSDGA